MNVPTMFSEKDYAAIDPILSSWAKHRGVTLETNAKGYEVRSLWMEHKIQLWIDAPDGEGFVRVHLAELRNELPSKWGNSIEWRTSQEDLYDTLDRVWYTGKDWL